MRLSPLLGANMAAADQINFQVPMDAPADGDFPIQVCIGPICSESVLMAFTNKDILLRVREKAYVHMPVWVDVEVPMNQDFWYSSTPCLWDFGGYRFEIRRDGQLQPTLPKRECSRKFPGFPSSFSGREALPLHLFYQFDEPGKYEIRLSGPLFTPDLTKVARTGYSDWIELIVEAHPEEARVAWLHGIEREAEEPAQMQDAGELVGSLIAWPDERALTALLRFLPPPRPTQPAISGHILKQYSRVTYCVAPDALAAFPDDVIRKVILPRR